MFRSSLRVRLLFTFFLLVVVVGAGTLLWIERTLADDLLKSLEERMTGQGYAVANWLETAGHPDRLAPRLADVTDTRITIIGADGIIQGDSDDASAIGRPVGEAAEVSRARRGEVGTGIRQLVDGGAPMMVVAVQDDYGRVIRLAVPLNNVLATRARMRNRLLVGASFGFVGCLILAWIFIRAVTKPLQSMTRTAEQLSQGNYDIPPPEDAGGELGVLARTMTKMATEVRVRISELTQQRDLLQTILDSLVEGVIVVDRSGAVVLVNEAGKPHVEDKLPASLDKLVALALAGKPGDEELELEGRTVRASTRPLHDRGAIAVLYDITRIRALEAVRREFLSNAAHELRTPITSISGYAETLLGGGVDADTGKEFLEIIHRNAGRIASLVNDLLVLDTLGGRATAVGDRGPMPLHPVARDAARTAKGVTPSAKIDVEVPTDLSVLATREGLDHVVQNLIDNAIKYGGGTPVTVLAKRLDRHVQLSVADAGPGIPKGMEERVFERFYRLDAGRSRDVGGSGLGLAIVKSQVEAMGGRVWVEDAKPGARFVIELDAA